MKQGFALFEVLITLFLMGIVFAVVANLASDYGRFSRASALESRRLFALREALSQTARLARSSYVVTPGSVSATASDRLELDMPTPQYPGFPLPESLPAGWQPDTPRQSIVVRLEGQRLLLERGSQAQVLAQDVTGFAVTRSHTARLVIEASWDVDGRLVRARSTSFLPLEVQP